MWLISIDFSSQRFESLPKLAVSVIPSSKRFWHLPEAVFSFRNFKSTAQKKKSRRASDRRPSRTMSTSATRNASSLIRNAGSLLTDTVPKRIVISGPSGFLGSRVLDCILRVHALRHEAGQKPGEVVLLSSSPGTLMGKLAKKYGTQAMKTVRASRVDYYSQHDANVWKDNFLSLGLEGEDCVFVNLAALAGPKEGIKDAMMDVNYKVGGNVTVFAPH